MKLTRLSSRAARTLSLSALLCGCVWACGFDNTLREYLNAHFWLPFARHADHFAKKGIREGNAPYAGKGPAQGSSPVARMRAAYTAVCDSENPRYNAAEIQSILTAARDDSSLTAQDREEVALIDAKIDMRRGSRAEAEATNLALAKLTAFLKTARNPEYRSEARGWIAHIHYERGNQTAAGKIYLDELNRPGSNLSYETLVNSLWMTYGYDGGPGLLEHLDEYFDTPEHAAFAIHLATNPHWNRDAESRASTRPPEPVVTHTPPYARLTNLLKKHAGLFRSNKGANLLALLGMRVAMNAGDPPAAIRIAAQLPQNSAVRTDPDFQWMLASAHFLSRDFAAAEAPLLALFASRRADADARASAAYGLCGVYQKTGNIVEQIRFALALRAMRAPGDRYLDYGGRIQDKTVYWAISGWDLNLLLETEASIETLRAFLEKYPNAPEVLIVRYSLAVRLARENEYEEAARLFASANAPSRAGRMRDLKALFEETSTGNDVLDAKYKMARYLAANSTRIYYNGRLWQGLQRYALFGSRDTRLSRAERDRQMAAERKLKDDQEELWRAYRMLREVARESGRTALGKRSAILAIQCLRRISTDRFEREDEIQKADIELSGWLAGVRKLI